jgi:hypothetical protein
LIFVAKWKCWEILIIKYRRPLVKYTLTVFDQNELARPKFSNCLLFMNQIKSIKFSHTYLSYNSNCTVKLNINFFELITCSFLCNKEHAFFPREKENDYSTNCNEGKKIGPYGILTVHLYTFQQKNRNINLVTRFTVLIFSVLPYNFFAIKSALIKEFENHILHF